MKTKIFLAALLLGVVATAFTIKNPFTKNAATVEQMEGIYIFYMSKPVAETEYIGTYKMKFIVDDKPKLLLPKLIREAKKQFPTCEAIIIPFDMYQCDAVKFK